MDGTWNLLLLCLVAGYLIWMLQRSYRNQPSLFSKANAFKSLHTLGIIAVGMLALIVFLVALLR